MTSKIPPAIKMSKELLAEIGMFFIMFSASESGLAHQLTRLISHPHKYDSNAGLVLFGASTKVLIQQIQILSRLKLDPKYQDAVIKICHKIRDSYDLRNDLAHFTAGPTKDEHKIILLPFKMKANGELVKEKILTKDQISDATDTLVSRMAELDRLLTEAGITPTPKRDEQDSAPQ